jgi:hypothetical protein
MNLTTRSGHDDPIHCALRAAICVPTTRYLWVPEDATTFEPGLCNTIYGDGRALFRLTTMNGRPAFYVIRGDSRWSVHDGLPNARADFVDVLDQIYEDLEAQFGHAELDSEENDPALLEMGSHPWPAFDAQDGSSWARMDWPEIPGIELEELSGARRSATVLKCEYAPEDHLGRLADDGGAICEESGFRLT